MDSYGKLQAKVELVRGPKTGLDILRLVSPTGRTHELFRNRNAKDDLLNSLGSYTKGLLIGGVLYPDGIARLLVLYGLAALLGSPFAVRTLVPGERTAVIGFARTAVLLFLPVISAYGIALLKWIVYGWYDPLLAGRVMIITATFVLLVLLVSVLVRGRPRSWEKRSVQVLRYGLFLVSDLLGVLANILTVSQFFRL